MSILTNTVQRYGLFSYRPCMEGVKVPKKSVLLTYVKNMLCAHT